MNVVLVNICIELDKGKGGGEKAYGWLNTEDYYTLK